MARTFAAAWCHLVVDSPDTHEPGRIISEEHTLRNSRCRRELKRRNANPKRLAGEKRVTQFGERHDHHGGPGDCRPPHRGMSPLIVAVGTSFSSVSVIANALR